jgi:hypothetical protein
MQINNKTQQIMKVLTQIKISNVKLIKKYNLIYRILLIILYFVELNS